MHRPIERCFLLLVSLYRTKRDQYGMAANEDRCSPSHRWTAPQALYQLGVGSCAWTEPKQRRNSFYGAWGLRTAVRLQAVRHHVSMLAVLAPSGAQEYSTIYVVQQPNCSRIPYCEVSELHSI
jgi:hypothetical protein